MRKEEKTITDEEWSNTAGGIILILLLVCFISIILNIFQYTIAYKEGYIDGYLRGQTDAHIRKWNNLELDSTSNVDRKEWILKSKVRWGN